MSAQFLGLYLLAASALAQLPAFDPAAEKLKCDLFQLKPQVDFAFRFQAGYTLRCPVRLYGGNKATIATYVQITPEGGKPVLLTEAYSLPEIPADMKARTNIHKLSNEFEISGGFSIGEGDYTVEVLVRDSSERSLKKTWHIRAARNREERNVEITMPPLTAGPLYNRMWDGKTTGQSKGLRLTILMNAAPRDPRSNTLRAWDRAMLLDSLSTILRRLPTQSVRLVAFNIDQQREIFRDNKLDRRGIQRLARSLRSLELGTVAYSVLKDRTGWARLLADLTNEEVTSDDPSDVVIFLGPLTRNDQKIPPELLIPPKAKRPRFFYFEFNSMWRRGNELPDAIAHITSARSGTTIRIHSPGELGQAIQKLSTQTR